MNEIYIIISIISISFIFLLLALFNLVRTFNKKLKILYYDTNESCKLLNAEPDEEEPNFIDIGDKRHDLTKAKPVLIKGLFGNRIFYQIHHKYVNPLKITEGKLIETLSPKTLKDSFNMNVIREFLREKGSSNNLAFIFLIIGGIIGALVVALLFFSGMINI